MKKNLPHLQPFSTIQVSTKWTKPCSDTVARTPYNSLYMDPRNFIQHVHVDGELLSGDDQLVRNMVRKLKQKFFVMKVVYLTKTGDKFQILCRTVERTKLCYVDTLTKASRTWTRRSAIL